MSYNILNQEELEKLKNQEPERFQKQMSGGEYINLQGLELENLEGIEVEKLQKAARIMRGLMFASIEASQSGHPGGSSSKVEQFLSITLASMAFDAVDFKNSGRDRMVWSAGHCSPGLYGGMSFIYECLRQAGVKLENVDKIVFPENLTRFRHADGPQGHTENYYPFSDIATGASGHGLSAATGLAIAQKSSGLDIKVWVFVGDAETEEGITYEARNVAVATGSSNLIVSLDYNNFGIDGNITEVMSSPYINQWLGLGWNVIDVNGENFLELIYAYRKAAEGFSNSSPTVVLAHTKKGKCYGEKENTAGSHGNPAKHDEYVKIMKELGFDIPGVEKEVGKDIEVVVSQIDEELVKYVADRIKNQKSKIKNENELVKQMETALSGRPFVNPRFIKRPAELPKELVFEPGTKVATRKATQAWFEWLMKQSAFFYAGTGDLSKSILTDKAEAVYGIINRQNPYGRGIRFGIAEQNMAMLSCALTQDVLPGGFQPVSVFSSYAVFTSMMANSVRMALIGNHLKPETAGFFIMLAAHDGPETGEDGPTHQGMYWMSMFTAYPGIKVYKPMDANETIEMLFYALEKGEPIALSVSRPDTVVLDRSVGQSKASDAVNGAYMFYESERSKDQKIKRSDVVIVVSGAIPLANTMEAVPELEKQGLGVKVVAVTSPQLFEELRKINPKKANEIFSDEDREIAVTVHNGWKGFLYPFLLPNDYEKRTISIDNYLRSGTVNEVYKLAELTSEDIKKKILNINL